MVGISGILILANCGSAGARRSRRVEVPSVQLLMIDDYFTIVTKNHAEQPIAIGNLHLHLGLFEGMEECVVWGETISIHFREANVLRGQRC